MLVDDRGALVCVSGHPMTGLLGHPPSIASHVVSLFRYFHPGGPWRLDYALRVRDSIIANLLELLRAGPCVFRSPSSTRTRYMWWGLVEGQQSYGSQQHEESLLFIWKVQSLNLEPHRAPRRHSDAQVACLIPLPGFSGSSGFSFTFLPTRLWLAGSMCPRSLYLSLNPYKLCVH